ncbi:hypothetical protein [Microbispora sp. H11081]|uniref:hypothetical protein n=1 Tax=Microbispora sp. H11081 TaxID=2729107 RepID=UPI0014748841|nr:hypothetical protein [Microbispora sp. H11081]
MTNAKIRIMDVRETLAPVAGSVAGAVVDPKAALKRLKSAVVSPKPLFIAAALAAAYALGRWHGLRACR